MIGMWVVVEMGPFRLRVQILQRDNAWSVRFSWRFLDWNWISMACCVSVGGPAMRFDSRG